MLLNSLAEPATEEYSASCPSARSTFLADPSPGFVAWSAIAP
ncbi:hypothetical protein [Amycolatopsis sp. NPDC049159]